MTRKIMILLTLNIIVISFILYLNDYRVFKSSFYKRDLELFETDSYEVIFNNRKISVVKYEDIYKIYQFNNFPVPQYNDNFYNTPSMFNFLTDFNADFDFYSSNLLSNNKPTQYRTIADQYVIILSEDANLEIKDFSYIVGDYKVIDHKKIEVKQNEYLYVVFI